MSTWNAHINESRWRLRRFRKIFVIIRICQVISPRIKVSLMPYSQVKDRLMFWNDILRRVSDVYFWLSFYGLIAGY